MKKTYVTPVSDVILLLDEEIHMFEVSSEPNGELSGGGSDFGSLF
jgi:hypothetical protein